MNRLCFSTTTVCFYNLTASSECSKLGERLLAGARHANKQCMTTIDAKDAVKSDEMFQSIIKQY